MVVAEIRIELKKGVADPEGKNTMKTLDSLGFHDVVNVKSIKVFEIEFDMDEDQARVAADEACKRLLANPVIQNYTILVR